MQEIVKNSLATYFGAIVIVGYFIYGLAKMWKVRTLNIELEKFFKKIKEIRKEVEEVEEVAPVDKREEQRIRYFRTLLSDPSEFMGEYPSIKEIGESYFKALKRKEFKGVNPSSYFNEEEILLANFNISRISQRASAYVGMGLLGTFIGIVVGLHHLGEAQSTMEQVSLIDEILPAMSLAFITSILGIICSLLYTKCEKTWVGEVTSNILKIDNNLNILFPNQTEIVKILESMQTTLVNLNQGLGKSLGKQVAESIDTNTKMGFKTFGKQVEKLGVDISNRLNLVFNEIFNKEFMEEFKEIQKSLAEVNKTISNTNKETKTILSDIPKYAKSFESLNNTSMKIYETSERATINYNKFLAEVKRIEEIMKQLNNFKGEVMEMLQASNRVVIDGSVKLEELSRSTYKTYEDISNEIKNIIETGRAETNTLIKSSNNILEQNLSSVNNILDKNLSNANSILEQNLSKVNNVNQKIEDNLNNLGQSFKITQETLIENIGKLEKIIVMNKNVIEEEYGKMAESQNILTSKTKEALVNYDNTISKLNKDIMTVISNIKDMI